VCRAQVITVGTLIGFQQEHLKQIQPQVAPQEIALTSRWSISLMLEKKDSCGQDRNRRSYSLENRR
jgi:hypothetical protein